MAVASIPVRLFTLPEERVFTHDYNTKELLPEPRVSYTTQLIAGSDVLKFYTDEDPTLGLNGSRKRLEDGNLIDVVAKLRVYQPSKGSPRVVLDSLSEVGHE